MEAHFESSFWHSNSGFTILKGKKAVYVLQGSWHRNQMALSLHSLLSVTGSPGGSNGRETACNAGDVGSIPELGRSPREGNGNPL